MTIRKGGRPRPQPERGRRRRAGSRCPKQLDAISGSLHSDLAVALEADDHPAALPCLMDLYDAAVVDGGDAAGKTCAGCPCSAGPFSDSPSPSNPPPFAAPRRGLTNNQKSAGDARRLEAAFPAAAMPLDDRPGGVVGGWRVVVVRMEA